MPDGGSSCGWRAVNQGVGQPDYLQRDTDRWRWAGQLLRRFGCGVQRVTRQRCAQPEQGLEGPTLHHTIVQNTLQLVVLKWFPLLYRVGQTRETFRLSAFPAFPLLTCATVASAAATSASCGVEASSPTRRGWVARASANAPLSLAMSTRPCGQRCRGTAQQRTAKQSTAQCSSKVVASTERAAVPGNVHQARRPAYGGTGRCVQHVTRGHSTACSTAAVWHGVNE